MSTLAIVEKHDLRKVDKDLLSKSIRSIILESYAYTGQVPQGNTPEEQLQSLDVQVKFLIEDINDIRQPVSIEQIRTAFKNGVRGVYGEWFGMNNKSYIGWIRGLLAQEKAASGGRMNSDRIKELPRPEPTVEEKEKIFQESIECCLANFRKTGIIMDAGGAIFDGLWRRKKIKLTDKQIARYKKKAAADEVKRINNEIEEAKQRVNRSKVTELTDIFDQIMADADLPIIKLTAKRLALADYFTTLTNEKV